MVEESVGWSSEGWTASDAYDIRSELQRNKKTGQGPRTLAEKRKIEQQERKQKKAREQAESLTLDEYWPTFYEHAKLTKKMTSAEKEESHWRLWLSPTLGDVPLRKIDLPQWDLLVSTLNSSKKSKRYIEYITGTLRRVLKHAYERGLVGVPPPTGKRIGATGPGNSNRRLRVISPDEASAILTEIRRLDVNGWWITRFAFLSGCRASEAFNMRWRDIDRARGVLVFPETKNRDARTIRLVTAIIDLLDELPKGKLDDHVFRKKGGTPYKEAPLTFKVAVDNLKLNNGRAKRDRISFHSIRHTVATELAKTLNPADLMDVMGWRTVQMAMRYVHANEDAKMAALAGLHYALKPKTTNNGKIIPIKRIK